MSESENYIYVCDQCGDIVTITADPIPEDEDWTCAKCESRAMWEFRDKQKAREHSEHIRRGVASGLFRRV